MYHIHTTEKLNVFSIDLLQGNETPRPGNEEGEVEMCDAEILDELTTSRGEVKVRAVSSSEDRRGQVNY